MNGGNEPGEPDTETTEPPESKTTGRQCVGDQDDECQQKDSRKSSVTF